MTNQNAPTAQQFLLSIKLLIVICTLSLTVIADTTSATDGSTPLGLQPGAPAGSYPLSGFDNVNLFNGNLNFQLSLLGRAGRGGAPIPVLLPIGGKWRVLDIALPQPDGSFNHHCMPVQSWWENNDSKYRPGSLVGRQGSFEVMTCPDNTPVFALTLTRLTFTSPDGTEYELRDQLTGGQVLGGASCNYLNPPSRGTVFVTSDGSAATFVSDTTIYDYVISPNPSPEVYPSGYLMLRDGTRFRVLNGAVIWMRDRNGNKLTFGYDSNNNVQTITDSLNRVVTISRNTGPGTFDQITYKGFGGAQRTIRVSYSSLASTLRSDYASTLTYKALFVELNGSSTTQHNPSVVSSITLPNNQQYQIKYNPYGEIARVVLPTGGAIEYDYAAGDGASSSGAFGGGYEGSWVVYRRVGERRVYPDGGTGSAYASRMTYSRTEAECAGCVKVDQLNNSGTLLTRSKHYFHGNAGMSFGIGPVDYAGWKDGKEYQTEEFASNGTTILRRTVTTWQQPTAGGSWPLSQAEANDTAKANSPQTTQIVTTLEPAQANKVSKQTFSYDKYTNRTDVYEYGLGTGAAGSLVRRTHTTHLTSSYDTLNPNSANPDLSLTNHIRNLPTQVSIFDAAGVERARSTTEYDNYVLDGSDCQHSFHCPLLARSNISGLDSLFSSSYTKRGNSTAVTRSLLSNGAVTGSVSTYSQYDVAGNVIRSIDPRSTPANFITTTIEYDDRFGTPNNEARANSVPTELTGSTSFAFPTKVINPLGHTVYAQFDYYLGRAVNGEDANGVVAGGYFNDLLDRPTQIRRAIGTAVESQTAFAYNDASRIVTISSDRDTYNDNLLVSKVLYDQMGRTIETRQYEGGDNYIVTQTQYDGLGRAFKSSNPFRPWQNEGAVWTTQAFDALGRVISVTTPDNAVVNTSYLGNSVTVTDQAGKARQSASDALGRLIEVYEDPNGVGFQTTYNYDVLDNLVKVTQGTQQRFFMYDSFKRLIRVRNPEQGTNGALSVLDPLTNNSAWSTGYQYDANNNLTFKTDPRGVVTENRYDALNRVTTVLFRINGQPDPNTGDVEYLYDNASNGKGRLWLTYRWGAKPSHAAVGQYDALGRVTQLYNMFGDGLGGWSAGYAINRTYNRAGSVTAQTYPSGHTVVYAYDSAGRTSSFTGNLGDGTNRTYSNNAIYSPFGGLTKEQFGTNTPLYHKSFYNIRGQLFDARLSSVNDTWDWNRGRLILYYSSNHLWGQSGTDNNGNVRFAETWIPPANAVLDQADTLSEDSYSYDSLNRLTSVTEQRMSASGGWVWQQQFRQAYSYDRYGNRTIDVAQTWGTGINNKSFEKEEATNRLYSPGDLVLPDNMRRLRYDLAGNQIKDTYTGYGTATFDAENHITAIQDSFAGWSYYTYNADGQRVRRKINNLETWQIYGIEGELLAEYPANGAAATPQKEYGYRNGQLLVTAETGPKIQWLIPDHLGTPRMLFDQTGSLSSVKRHDYLPFGEELFAGAGGRTVAQGYSGGDGVRQQFTSKERDIETGLDYFGARYHSSVQGRFTSIDPMGTSPSRQLDPQQLNRYSTVRNNPLKYTDPDGRDLKLAPGLKKADQDRIIKRAVNLYRKASGRASLERLESSDIKFEVRTGNLPSKTNVMDRTVRETYGDTKPVQFKYTRDPGDPTKFASIDRTSVTVQMTFDFSKRDDAQTAYDNRLSSTAPTPEQHLVNHEFGHADDMNNDMVREANQGTEQAEKNAEAFANTAEGEKDSLSKEAAEKRVREIFGIPAKQEKQKEKKDNE